MSIVRLLITKLHERAQRMVESAEGVYLVQFAICGTARHSVQQVTHGLPGVRMVMCTPTTLTRPAMLIRMLFASAALASLAGTQETCPSGITTRIDWVLPGQFDRALARSKAEGRLLLIKGVSFGIDDAGAKCATKGKW